MQKFITGAPAEEENPLRKPDRVRVLGSYSHHSAFALDSGLLNYAAQKAVAEINEALVSKGRKVSIVFRGLSGSTIAGAILAEASRKGVEIGAFYVRKEFEDSHGTKVEYGTPWPASQTEVFVIVDDFVDSGNTIKEMYEVIAAEYPAIYEAEIGHKNGAEAPDVEWGICLIEDSKIHNVFANGFNISFMKHRFGCYF